MDISQLLTLVRSADSCDLGGKFDEALGFYVQAIEEYMELIKREKDEVKRESFKAKVSELLDKAERIKNLKNVESNEKNYGIVKDLKTQESSEHVGSFLERVKFFGEKCSELFDVKISKYVWLPKSLILFYSRLKIWEYDESEVSENVTSEMMIRMIFGMDECLKFDEFDNELLIEYFKLFGSLGMENFQSILCKKVAAFEVSRIILLLKHCRGTFEEKLSNSSFRSVLTLCLYNEIKKKEELLTDMDYKLLRELGIENLLKRNKKKEDLRNHVDFIGMKFIKDYDTFHEIFSDCLNELYDKKPHWNLILKTETGGYRVKCHKEVLIYKSNFFFQIFEGNFNESSQNEIEIRAVCSTALDAIVQFMYLGFFEENALLTLLEILLHSEMYFEDDLRTEVNKKIDDLVSKYSKSGELELKILEVGFFLNKLTQRSRLKFVERCSKVKDKCLIEKLILYSETTWKAVEEKYSEKISFLEGECKELRIENEGLKSQNQDLRRNLKRKRNWENSENKNNITRNKRKKNN